MRGQFSKFGSFGQARLKSPGSSGKPVFPISPVNGHHHQHKVDSVKRSACGITDQLAAKASQHHDLVEIADRINFSSDFAGVFEPIEDFFSRLWLMSYAPVPHGPSLMGSRRYGLNQLVI